jgi:hypothetical protein
MKRVNCIFVVLALLVLPVSAISQDTLVPSNIETSPTPFFNSDMFQSGIRSPLNIGGLAKQNSPIDDKGSSFGFAAKSDEARFFLIGASYSEALAYLGGGKPDLASQRLQYIEEELINMGAPSSLYTLISKTHNMLETGQYPTPYVRTVLSFFQPFFEEFAQSKSGDKLILFRAGSFLSDIGLAAAAGNKELLKQSTNLTYFSTEMKRMDAPKGVLEALAEMNTMSEKETLTDNDPATVLKLVKKIEQLLS